MHSSLPTILHHPLLLLTLLLLLLLLFLPLPLLLVLPLRVVLTSIGGLPVPWTSPVTLTSLPLPVAILHAISLLPLKQI